MAPVTNHTVVVTLAGIDRSAHLRKDSLFVRSNIGNTTDVAEFTIIDDGSFQILDWDEVTISIDGTRVFGGFITASSGAAVGDVNNRTTMWSVECKDWSALFDVTPVTATYTDTGDDTIIDNLFDTYLSADGFDSTTNITSQYSDVDIDFDHVTFREALDQLAGIVKAQWHLDPNKAIYWYAEIDPDAAAFNIDTVAPNNSTTFDVLLNSLKAQTDSAEIVNRVTVIGGWSVSGTKQIDLLTGVSTETIYGPLTQPPSAMWAITFIDSNDVVRTAYANDIGVYPVQVVDDEGDTVYDSELEYIVTANLDTGYIEFDLSSISPATLKDGSVITVQYYYKVPIEVTRDDTASQGQYGRIFHRYIFDESLSDLLAATRYADKVLAEYSNGRITVRFDVTRHGLLPGRLITINTPAFNISTVLAGLLQGSDRGGYFLLENGSDRIALENYDSARTFLIQEVAIQTVVVHQDEFMIVASITAGRWIKSLVDDEKKSTTAQYQAGLRTGNRTYGSLSQVSGNLGEIATGRAVFTDGGNAQFSWTDYADHTGIVVGLEETGQPAPYGAAYVLQDGIVRAKLGKMDGLDSVSAVAPTGWGIWTTNGYFSGVIAANAGQIGGWTIAANAIYADDGTLSTSVPPINSSNPGVYMSTAGLFGYGPLGLTFSIPADPTLAPYFSSGTINNAVYEVYESGVIRTSANPSANGGVQMDDSGIFAYATPANGGGLKFSVDANTGLMAAVGGAFSGVVSASEFNGGTVTGGTVTGAKVSGGTVTGALVTGGTVSAAGGSITLTTNQMAITVPTTFTPASSTAFIEWKTDTGGTVARTQSTFTGSTADMHQIIGTPGPNTGRSFHRTYGTVNGVDGDYSEVQQINNEWALGMVRNSIELTPPIRVAAGLTTVGGSVIPSATGFYSLGGTSNFWETLYTNNIIPSDNLTFSIDGAGRVRLHRTSNSWEPVTDIGQSLGRSGQRWSEVWASNGAIQTSDLREKESVERTPLGLDFIKALEPISWTWKKNDDGRTHHGLSAQGVKAAVDKLAVDFGGYIYDPENDTYHLRYSEFVAPLVAAIQEIADRVEQLEAKA